MPLNALAILLTVAAQSGPPAPASVSEPSVVHGIATIKGASDDWFNTGIKLGKGDRLFFRADGKVKVGSWIGEVGPNGNVTPEAVNRGEIGLGTLVYKIGQGTPAAAGVRLSTTAVEAGSLKFKVHDTKYTDNAGDYKVTVVIVRAAAIPEPAPVQGEDGVIGRASTPGGISSASVKVAATNDEWTATGLTCAADDYVLFTATGEGSPSLPAGGANGVGGVFAKVGAGKPAYVGSRAAMKVTDPGPIKVRVQFEATSGWANAKGSAGVNVVLVPAKLVPEARELQPTD